ncbi:YjiH family protein, partial [Vibrio parahaemolyticus]|nr:YjiH family protein [Vibrio parahaemolyticus]MDG2680006.1 YjiH family protein [Vibrio parahaemolyticus]
VGANLFRIYLNITEGKEDKQEQSKSENLKEETA